MEIYTFDKKNSGIYGDAFEMSIKRALNRKNADRISPCGTADFRYNNKNYDSKQNGSPIKYGNHKQYVKGSNRVIYASHIAYNIVAETETEISITVDLVNTKMFVVDKQEFVNFLLANGLAKDNPTRCQINIQTGYNYKKAAYHGRVGKRIESWCKDHELNDNIITDILDAVTGL